MVVKGRILYVYICTYNFFIVHEACTRVFVYTWVMNIQCKWFCKCSEEYLFCILINFSPVICCLSFTRSGSIYFLNTSSHILRWILVHETHVSCVVKSTKKYILTHYFIWFWAMSVLSIQSLCVTSTGGLWKLKPGNN